MVAMGSDGLSWQEGGNRPTGTARNQWRHLRTLTVTQSKRLSGNTLLSFPGASSQ